MITPITNAVLGNEKAMGLFETHLQSPGNKGFHRYQVINVIRDGTIAEFRRDMGLAKNFKGVKYLIIPSDMEHTVDELMGLADELRYEINIDLKDWLHLDTMKLA